MSDLSSRSEDPVGHGPHDEAHVDPGGRIESTISRSRRRSLSELMRREIPTWSTVGMNTR